MGGLAAIVVLRSMSDVRITRSDAASNLFPEEMTLAVRLGGDGVRAWLCCVVWDERRRIWCEYLR